jgi:predicted aconitase
MQAPRLRAISGAHIDSCLYHGTTGLDFATRLADGGASVAVPTTLNVSSLDLLHPELYRGDAATAVAARSLMTQYERMGCRPTWTCAPYQLDDRPGFGDHLAWAESNAIVFANSVLGARTHRYGDFIDIAAAIVGRVPDAGLHTDEARLGQVLVDVRRVPERVRELDVFYPMLGLVIGTEVGTQIPVIIGLPPTTTEDQLKAIGSAGATSGSMAMFHAVGCTPEAPTVEAAFGGRPPIRTVAVTMADVRRARDRLTTTTDGRLGAVSLGTPHYSAAQLGRLVASLAGRTVHPAVLAYVSTGRDVLVEANRRGWGEALADAGVQIVTDTCTYITPVMADVHGSAMTDSAKWAYYAPGNLGLDVVFGSVDDCVESAVAGRIVRDEATWADD